MSSGRVRVSALCLCAVLALAPVQHLAAEPAAAAKDPMLPRVRGVTPQMKELIASGVKRSVTFRRLVETIDRSDVVVYIDVTKDLPSGLEGRLTFLTSAGGTRYLSAQLMPGLNTTELIALAAHELQHAIEVAAHPEVGSAEALRGLYQRIGIRGVVKDRYDTAEAQSTGRRVRAELG